MSGDTIVLDERFEFNDGERSTRKWTIELSEDDGVVARADDVIGDASGRVVGNAMSLGYLIDLDVGDLRDQGVILQIHGLDDQYLLHPALDGTWEWLDGPYTLVTLPGVNHFVQEQAPDAVNEAILKWLGAPSTRE